MLAMTSNAGVAAKSLAALEDALLDATIQAERSALPPTPASLRDPLLLQPGPVTGSGVSLPCEACRGVWQQRTRVRAIHWQDQRGGVGD
jgi:hypothetical protein